MAEFLKREDEKLAEIEMSRTSPPPDTNGGDEEARLTPDSRGSPVHILNEYSEQPIVGQRRPSVEAPSFQRSPSIEALSSVRRSSYEGIPQLPIQDMDVQGYSEINNTQEESLFGEPECIQTWRRQKEEMLDQKEAEASEEMRGWRESAQQELRDWYDHHNSQVETRKQDNRSAEEAFINERDQSVPGTEWEKVANLCEFSGKAKTSKDVSRMRSIYLHLKENPPVRNL